MELLNDPVLKTTSNNYNFKYVSSEDFERVIKSVQRDRVKATQDTIWDDFCRLRLPATADHQPSPKPKAPLHGILKNNVNSMKVLSRENTHRLSPKTPKKDKNVQNTTKQCPAVRVLTDEEIKNIIDSAFKEVIDKPSNTLSSNEEHQNINNNNESLHVKSDKNKSDNALVSNEKSNSNEKNCSYDDNKSNEKDKNNRKQFKTPVLLQDIDVKSYCSSITISSNHSDKSNEKNLDDNDSDFDIDDDNDIALSPIEKEQIRKLFRNNDDPSYMHVHYENNDSELALNSRLKMKGHFKNKIDSEFDINDDVDESEDDDSYLIKVDDFNYNADYIKQNKKCANNIYPVVRIKAPFPSNSNKEGIDEDEDEDDYDATINDDQVAKKNNVTNKDVVQKQLVIVEENCNTSGGGDNGNHIKLDFNNIEKSRDLFGMNSHYEASFQQRLHSPEHDDTILLQNLQEKLTERDSLKRQNLKRNTTSFKRPETAKLECKQEVIALLSKITSFQKKILTTLDEIKANLLDITEPDGACDIKRRQKRSTEFTTRFARNYLYQIGRLTEDIRIFIPKDSKQFKISQDISIKICALYNVILQAALSYNKNMCNFITDRNPDKLQVFLNLIINSTKLCCEKHIFDINDLIVKNILEKCCDIIIYSQNINTNPSMTNYRVEFNKNANTQKKMKHYPKKWEPSPVKNKLSMYDSVMGRSVKPTSSLKRMKQKSKSKSKLVINIKETNAHNNSNGELSVNNKSDVSCTNLDQLDDDKGLESAAPKKMIKNSFGDNINTMMENVMEDDTMSIKTKNKSKFATCLNGDMGSQQTISSSCIDLPNMNDTVMEALQSITKQQVQEILGPLMSNIGLLLSDKSPVNVQTILNGLNKKNINTTMPKSPLPLTSNDLLPQTTLFINNNNKNDENINNNNNNYNQNNDIDDTTNNVINANINDDNYNSNIDNNEGIIDNQGVNITKELARDVDKRNKSIPNGNIIKNIEKTSSNMQLKKTNKMNSSRGGSSSCNHQINLKTNKINDEKIVFHSKNIQYTYITSKASNEVIPIDDNNKEDVSSSDAKKLIDEISQFKNDGGSGDYKVKLNNVGENPDKKKSNKKIMDKMKNSILKERTKFIQQIANNSLYVNDNFTAPWKVVSRIADQIAEDILLELDSEIDFDEKNFILDFLINELS